MSGDVSPRDRGQVRLMRAAGLSIQDVALYFGASEKAVERTLTELAVEVGPETSNSSKPPIDGVAQQQAQAVELAHSLYRLLGSLCQHPAHGRGSCIEAAWDLADEVIWLLDPSDNRPVPRVRQVEA